jgi:tripartite-type tricarboxylate transporter receptor subunit TctC
VRVLIGFPPGGGVDIIGRLVAPKLSEKLGQPVIVENRAGANGNIAMDAAAKSAPDGYTLFYGNIGNLAVTNALYRNLGFDTARDFAPMAQTIEVPLVVAVADSVRARTLQDLVAYAKANPGKLNAGSAGAGGPSHLTFEVFKRAAKADITHVPYRGSAPALQDLAGGRIDLMLDAYNLMRPMVEAGKVRVLAVTAAEPQALLPEVPTAGEAGMPGFVAASWHAFVAPAATPPAVVRRVGEAVGTILRETELRRSLAAQGATVRHRDAAELKAYMAAERQRWTAVIKEAGITVD